METIKSLLNQAAQFVIEGDHNYFHHINQEWTNSWFDSFMPYITDIHKSWVWILVGLGYMVYKRKGDVVPIIVGLILTVAMSDVVAARVIKPIVQRDRPEVTEKSVRLLVPSQRSYGFPSNHAANMFAAGFFLTGAFPGVGLLTLAAAFVVAYSRVYVGVHFPLDVLAGALLGLLCAALVFKGYVLFHELADPLKEPSAQPKEWKKRKF